MDLSEIRSQIDGIDRQLSSLFQQRMALSAAVSDYKKKNNLPVLDIGRERAVIASAEASAEEESLKPALRRFYEGIMAESRLLQQNVLLAGRSARPAFPTAETVAYLGPEGSFSHEALGRHFGPDARSVPFASFEDAVDAVIRGQCRYGILPVENSLTGGVFAVTDLLAQGTVRIIGETVLPVRHCLLALPGTVASDIHAVLSHPQPLEQCRQYILRKGYDTTAFSSTAGAAAEVARRGDISVAAIASAQAGKLHGLVPLAHDIQDNPANFTRFAIVSASATPIDGADKISAVFVVEHRPGTLYGALRAFADRGINLLNLVSRPVPGSPWQYCFHMDFGGNLTEPAVQEALKEAGENCRSILILGNYKRYDG